MRSYVDNRFSLILLQLHFIINKIKFQDIDGYTPPVSKVTLLGDANCDNKVTVADAVAILQSIANKDRYALTEQGNANADCYDPGSGVTAKDAYTIQKLDAKVISSLPETAE